MNEFPVQRLCKVRGVSQSGYFTWRNRQASDRQREDLFLVAHTLVPCHPAWSRTRTAWVFSGRVITKSARKRLPAAVDTQGRTSAKSSPVLRRTAAKP